MKKHILMVTDMACANCAKKIEKALSETRVDFEINLEQKAVIVHGDADMIAVAKKTISDIGFTVL